MERDAESPEDRALRALRAIDDGADIGAEAFALSNEFTDRHTARLSAWLRRRRRPSVED
ncbi:hypothetical protein SAMN04487848_0376 [Microbacterium sp. ru370.1]|uniref:hypothetical protein n=1 Tax=unclassified Microbacterium TaxID=2609290 RepID=UPI00087EBAE3|nr:MULTISPECIES: hypothetical protein [unclassified Microbacterium]SDO32071.1 hypothetical protein SAMN04487848_0376 [Microbacterium sp. ru370.1]SIT76636.1 hypothetical protein SAMN05880579_0372 [Microbacterium sp. RU1D]